MDGSHSWWKEQGTLSSLLACSDPLLNAARHVVSPTGFEGFCNAVLDNEGIPSKGYRSSLNPTCGSRISARPISDNVINRNHKALRGVQATPALGLLLQDGLSFLFQEATDRIMTSCECEKVLAGELHDVHRGQTPNRRRARDLF